jgi:hypothetical protein
MLSHSPQRPVSLVTLPVQDPKTRRLASGERLSVFSLRVVEAWMEDAMVALFEGRSTKVDEKTKVQIRGLEVAAKLSAMDGMQDLDRLQLNDRATIRDHVGFANRMNVDSFELKGEPDALFYMDTRVAESLGEESLVHGLPITRSDLAMDPECDFLDDLRSCLRLRIDPSCCTLSARHQRMQRC